MKKHQRSHYRTPTISLQDYTRKIITTSAPLAEYLEFIKKFRYALTSRDIINTTCWLVISLNRKGYEDTGTSHGDWCFRMAIYETPTFYEWIVNNSEMVTIIDKYEDKTTFEIQDLGEYLANLPRHQVPSRIILGEREAQEFLSGETVPISYLLDSTILDTQAITPHTKHSGSLF
jgi:hypothetical protein